MKQALALPALAAELTRQRDAKRDFIVQSPVLRMVETGDALQLPIAGADAIADRAFGIRDHAHGQIASRLNIPKRYYDRMRQDAPDLLAANVNRWFGESDERRMVRTLDGATRAILSDRYQRIENEEIAEVALPVLADQPDMRVESAAVTETRLYIKALFPRIEGEVRKGDVVQAGVVISNSEVGAGAVTVTPLIFRLVCLNGMIREDGRLRGFHIGAKAIEGESVYELLTDETRQADDRAILLKVRDVIKAAAQPEFFARALERMRESTTEKLTGDPAKAVEVLATKAGLSEGERGGVLRHLIEGGDISRWGVLNAVTRASQDVASYDRATELEALGGKILDLPRSEWREIAEAA
jgi:hypothetical protein